MSRPASLRDNVITLHFRFAAAAAGEDLIILKSKHRLGFTCQCLSCTHVHRKYVTHSRPQYLTVHIRNTCIYRRHKEINQILQYGAKLTLNI